MVSNIKSRSTYKKAIGLIAILLTVGAVGAAIWSASNNRALAGISINPNDFSIFYGDSRDTPSTRTRDTHFNRDTSSSNVQQALADLSSYYNDGLALNLVNAINSRNLESLLGTDTYKKFSLSDLNNLDPYIDPNGVTNKRMYIASNRMYTESGKKTHKNNQVAIVKVEEFDDWYVLGGNNLGKDNGGSGGGRDYEDMIIGLPINRTVSVPEPSTIALFGLGIIGLGIMAVYRKKVR